jgi:predicted PurR-regulated permease PerM
MKKIAWIQLLVLLFVTLIMIRVINQTDMLMYFLGLLKQVAFPLFWGGILAFLMDPFVRKLNHITRLPRLICVPVAAICFAVIVFIILIYFVPVLITGFKDLVESLPTWINQLESWMNDFEFNEAFRQLGMDEIMRSNAESLNDYVQVTLNHVFNSGINVIRSTTSVLLSLLFTCMAAIFFLWDKEKLLLLGQSLVLALCSERHAAFVLDYAAKSKIIFYRFVVGKVIQAMVLTGIGVVGFTLIGVPYAVLVSAFVGVTNIIPYVGPVIGAIFAVLVALFSADPINAVYAAMVVAFIQLVDNLVCQPKILGGKVGLAPIYILAGVLTGAALFGGIGMLLAIPVCAILKLICGDYISYRLKAKGWDDELAPLSEEEPRPPQE